MKAVYSGTLLAVLLASLSALHAADVSPSATKPNIIFILADDLGWGDLGCYGHPVLKTPFLDKMAEDGLLVTKFYVANPVCSPSWTAVMTGQYPARHGIHQHFASHEINQSRNMPDFLYPNVTLLIQLMQDNGYKTAHIGKWHLGSTKLATAYGIDVNPSINGPRNQSTEKMVDEAHWFYASEQGRSFLHQSLDPGPSCDLGCNGRADGALCRTSSHGGGYGGGIHLACPNIFRVARMSAKCS